MAHNVGTRGDARRDSWRPDVADEGLHTVEGEYPDWRIWRSDRGTWWASRKGRPLADAELTAGLSATVAADSLPGLTEQLAGQNERATSRQRRIA